MAEAVRIDKWLWAVRIYKTRRQATEACRKGHVSIGNLPVKPSRALAYK
jgi:ribosome-associated heat shock protein Hsp15